MVSRVDFERAIDGAATADCRELEDRFSKAAEIAKRDGNEQEAIVYAALSALCGFHFKPNDIHDPYGPMLQFEGKRSAIPEDFRATKDAVATMAETATDTTLKARLSDVAWLLNRRRVDLGLAAISAYCETVSSVATGAKRFRFEKSNSPYSSQARDLLKRALSLATLRSVGLGKPEEAAARQLADKLFAEALIGIELRDVQRMAKLSMQYDIRPAQDIGASVEGWLHKNGVSDDQDCLSLLRLAASAYHRGGSMSDHFRCKLAAANTLVRMAQRAEERSAMLAGGLLADAIAELHGVPNVKELRLQLRHRLVDVQANIVDEMGTFSHPLDLDEIIADTEASFDGLSLRDMLFSFAGLSVSPTPEDLRAQALKSIEDNPLSSIFSASFHDRDGKVAFRTSGIDLNSAPTDESLRPTIAQGERIRRQIVAAANIQTARRLINEYYSITEETLLTLMNRSGFVPRELVRTYSKGFSRFFQGDFVSSIYILTPLLEASIRHVLKAHGHDVSKFDTTNKTQQDLTISAMFDQMKLQLVEIFGSAIVTDIDNVFLSQPGPTLRHDVAHGLLDDSAPFGADSAYACWLIFRLCMIPLFPYRQRFDEQLWQ